jgi:hypothetical protein
VFAQRLAAFCLVNLVVSMGWGASKEAADSELVVFLSADSGQSPYVLVYMKHELGQLMQTAGYEVVWRDAEAARPAQTSGPLIVARLQGICSVPAGDLAELTAEERPASLASTSVMDGRVLPFSTVNCGNLTHALAPMLSGEPGARRDFLYGRALARVLAHEFYHILAGSTSHALDGVAKSCFTPADLLTEPFGFEQATLAKLQKHTASAASEASAGDEVIGRQ